MANGRGKVEAVTDFLFLGSKITADGDCSHKIRRWLLLGRKAMTNVYSVFKSKDILLPTNVLIVKAMVFLVVMNGWETWTLKTAEHWRIDTFEQWCWRLLRVPWKARRSNQSILKEVNPEYSLEGLMLKLQYFDHLMHTPDSLERTLMLSSDWGQEEKRLTEDEMVGWHHQFIGHELGQFREMVRDREVWCTAVHGSQRVGHNLVIEQQQK